MTTESLPERVPAVAALRPPFAHLGPWIASLDVASGSRVWQSAVRSIVDTVGAAIAGADRSAPVIARQFAFAHYGHGPCRVFGHPGSLTSTGAAFANAVAAHALDFDDTCYSGIAHGSAVVLPAVLAAGQAVGASGQDLIRGFVAGSEVVYRIGHLFGDDLYFRGFWNTGVLGTVGAAAAAAKVMGLPAPQVSHALAIAASQIEGLRACLGTLAKPLLAGRAAEAGVGAAALARLGADGPGAVLEGENGWADVLNNGRFHGETDRQLASGDRFFLGDRSEDFFLIDPGVAFKLFPVCSAAQAAVEAVLELLAEHHLSGDDVARVVCYVPELVLISLRFPRPATSTEAQFSMTFAVGSALAFGRLTPAELTPATLADPRLAAAMVRVEMRPATELPVGSIALGPEGAKVVLSLHDGRTLERVAPFATGTPERPMPDAQLDDKFFRCAVPAIGHEAADRMLARLRRLESVDDLGRLFPFPL